MKKWFIALGVSTMLISANLNAHSEPEVIKQYLSWQDISNLSIRVQNKLPQKNWKGIVAITRGGLAPALLMSEMLNIRNIEVINVQSYSEDRKQGKLNFLKAPNLEEEGRDWLIIDDLSDSGETLKAIRKKFPNATYATLLTKPKGEAVVDYYGDRMDQEVWVVFPWEEIIP